MMVRATALLGALGALCLPAAVLAQGSFGFETIPYATQTSFSEADGALTATFSSLSATSDAFQVLDNTYPPGTPFYSYNMKHQVLVENSVGAHALQIQFSAMQKALHISFGLPNAGAQLLLEIPSLGVSQTFTGADSHPLVSRDLPYEGEILFDGGPQRFTTVKLSSIGAIDGAFGIDNVRVSAVPEGSSLAMLAIGGLPVTLCIARRRRRGAPSSEAK